MPQHETTNPADQLRHDAETQLARDQSAEAPPAAASSGGVNAGHFPPPFEHAALVHELQVHQIELEMQNAQLLESRHALETSLDRYRELYDHAPVGYLTVDRSGTIQLGNLCGAQMLGLDQASVVGHRLAAFLDDDSKVVYASLLHHMASGGTDRLVDLTIVEAGIEPLVVSVHTSREASGTDLRLILVDVTANRDAERNARLVQRVANEAQRQRLVRIALDGLSEEICVLDNAGQILLDNAAWRARIADAVRDGMVTRDVVGDASFGALWEAVMHPDSAQGTHLRTALDDLLDGHAPELLTQFPVGNGHGSRWYRLHATTLRGPGPERLIISQQDISAQHESLMAEARLADQLRESQKMEALGVLAGGVAHDFNNLLGSILGNVSLARLAPHDEASMTLSLEEIERAGRRASDLVQQILAFSRRQPRDLSQLSLADVVRDVTRLIRASIPTGVDIASHVDADTPSIRGDATQMHQVLINLCTNAWLAMDTRDGGTGSIDIRVDRFVVPADHDHDPDIPAWLIEGVYARLSVTDTGAGMDEATLTRVFEPFFTTRPTGAGTGLGLSVVHGIVVSHGGAIAARSTPGLGSTFTVYLPAVAPDDTVPSGRADTLVHDPAVAGGAGAVTTAPNEARVVVIDDEPAVLKVEMRLLRSRGYQVTGFADPVRAVEALSDLSVRVDVLVCDQNMPRLSGIEVARAVHVGRPELPVVIATGLYTAELRDQAQRTGVHHLLNKPDIATELLPLLESIRRQA